MKRRALLPLLAATLLLLAAGIAAALVAWGNLAAPLEERWLRAVERDDPEAAVALASRIVDASRLPPVSDAYVEFARREGLRRAYLEGPFNAWDHRLWRRAWFLRDLARRLAAEEPDDEVGALFRAVTGRVRGVKDEASGAPWPERVWERGKGLCDRQAWLLCELAWQRSFETQIVYLRNLEKKTSPHTICEIRRGEDVWFADPYRRVLLPGRSVESVALDAELVKKIWPDRPDFREAIRSCVLWTPAYAQDYCPRNQRLARRLREVLKDRCPRFGDDPDARLARYKKLRGTPLEGAPEFPMGRWFYPLRLLRAELRS